MCVDVTIPDNNQDFISFFQIVQRLKAKIQIIMHIMIKVANLEEIYLRSCTFSFSLVLANSVVKKAKYIIFNFWYFLLFGRFSNDQYTKSMRII